MAWFLELRLLLTGRSSSFASLALTVSVGFCGLGKVCIYDFVLCPTALVPVLRDIIMHYLPSRPNLMVRT
jgi:hypothetical protein